MLIIALKVILGAGAFYALHRFCLWMEAKGWIYYKTKPKGGGAGNALQELQAFMNPAVKHVKEAKASRKISSRKGEDK